jgi:hypothetical protein
MPVAESNKPVSRLRELRAFLASHERCAGGFGLEAGRSETELAVVACRGCGARLAYPLEGADSAATLDRAASVSGERSRWAGASPTAPPAGAETPSRGRRGWLIALALALCGIAVAAAIIAWGKPSDPEPGGRPAPSASPPPADEGPATRPARNAADAGKRPGSGPRAGTLREFSPRDGRSAGSRRR